MALRLFFALVPEAGPAAELVAQVAPFVAQLQARAVPAENLHATLCFVGAVEEEKLAALRAVAADVRGRRATLCFDTLEIWEKPKILCATAAGCGQAAPAEQLAHDLGVALVAAGFSPDIKPFRAHFTLGRKVSAVLAAELGAVFPRPLDKSLLLQADRFALMSSRREDERSIYSVVDSWLLDARETQCFEEK
jgi:RNA 2',3'-cyclic 3'-phosphodiesterase